MKTYEFWRELETGEVWAVELVDGLVARCSGPLHHGELDRQFLEGLDYAATRAAWVEAHREAFELYEPERHPFADAVRSS
jgi:hypothetical protein